MEKDRDCVQVEGKRREEDEMTVLLRILGYFWLAFSGVAVSIVYGFIWIVEGRHSIASTFLSGGALGSIGLGVMAMPGVALVALGIWMDRPRRARSRHETSA